MVSGNKYFLNDRYIFDASAKSLVDEGGNGNTTWLGTNESNILLAFIERPNEILSRDQIHQLVWTDNGFHVDESSVIQSISTVRKVLKDSAKDPKYIKTIPKYGYQFIAHSQKIETCVEDEINKPAKTDEVEEQKYTPEQESVPVISDNKSAIKKPFNIKIPLFLFSVLGLIIVGSYLSPVNVNSPKHTNLQFVEKIKDVDVYVLNQLHSDYSAHPEIKYCVTQLLNDYDNVDHIDKIIASNTSRNELVLNVVDKYLNRSVGYTLLAKNVDMKAFCDMRFNSAKN